MKININSIDDWEDLDELPIKEKIVKKKKVIKKKDSVNDTEEDSENINETDIYEKEGE